MSHLSIDVPKLSEDAYSQVADALRNRAQSSGMRDKRRLRRIAGEGPLMDLFIGHAYVRYLHSGGTVGDTKEFIAWLLDFINNHPEVLLTFVSIVLKIFGV